MHTGQLNFWVLGSKWPFPHCVLRFFSLPLYVNAKDGAATSVYWNKFDVHVTMHRVKFLIIKATRCTDFWNLFLEWNSTCFGQFLCPSSGVFHCTHSNGICHTGLLTACENSMECHPDPVVQVCWQLASRNRMEFHGVPSWSWNKALKCCTICLQVTGYYFSVTTGGGNFIHMLAVCTDR